MSRKENLYKKIIGGHLLLNLPVIIFCIGIPVSLSSLASSIPLKVLVVIAGFALGIVISWIWWEYFVTKWRLWAFDNISDEVMIALKELAIKNRLIWFDGSGNEKMEIRTSAENSKIKSIKQNIHELEQIEELKLDLTAPDVYEYKLNKKENVVESIAMLLVLLVAILL